MDSVQIFQAGYFFTKQRISMVFHKTTIMSLFYLGRLASTTKKQELQTSNISFKAPLYSHVCITIMV